MGVKGLIDFDFTHSFIYSPICLFLLTYSLVWMNKNYYLFIQSSYDFDAFILYVLFLLLLLLTVCTCVVHKRCHLDMVSQCSKERQESPEVLPEDDKVLNCVTHIHL